MEGMVVITVQAGTIVIYKSDDSKKLIREAERAKTEGIPYAVVVPKNTTV